jgi:hypothetical protein
MDWGEWGTLIAVIVAMIIALARIRNDPAYTPEVRRRSYRVLVGYVIYLAAGVAVLLALPLGMLRIATFGFLLLAILVYIAWGGLWILRLTPSRRPPPAWVLKPWTRLDAVLIAVFAVGVAGTVWGLMTP